MNLPWHDVQLFLALLRSKTLAGAGQQLGCDTSTASRRLVKLEQALDVTLFDRTREGLVATRAAEQVREAAEQMEQAAHAFMREAGHFEREVEGTVRISAPPGVAESFVVPAVVTLARRFPRLRVEIDSTVRQADLSRREADLALRTIRPARGPLVMQHLARAPWVPVASPELANRSRLFTEWNALPWVGWGLELEGLHVAKWLAARPGVEPVLRTNAFAVQLMAVQQSLGAALIPEPYLAIHGLERLQPARRLLKDLKALPADDLWLVTHEALRHVPRVDAVWSVLLEQFAVRGRTVARRAKG